jgi:hypothetical protein
LSCFSPKKTRGFRNQRKFLSIKAKDGHGRALKNVLTEKTGVFGGRLAEERGGRSKKRHFFSCFFDFLGLCDPQAVGAEDFPAMRPLKKNRAKKPTVGFWVFAGSGNIGRVNVEDVQGGTVLVAQVSPNSESGLCRGFPIRRRRNFARSAGWKPATRQIWKSALRWRGCRAGAGWPSGDSASTRVQSNFDLALLRPNPA